jgi:hypothetical protein
MTGLLPHCEALVAGVAIWLFAAFILDAGLAARRSEERAGNGAGRVKGIFLSSALWTVSCA